MIVERVIDYYDNDTVLEGYLVFDGHLKDKRPLVLIAHDWSGKNKFTLDKAKQLAELGYVGFALDMFGKGITGQTKEEKMALISPLLADRKALQRRMQVALKTASAFEQVDPTKTAAMGFCFGGLCVLDLARSGAKIGGVVSIHGLLGAPEGEPDHTISAKVLALHGYDDPMGPPDTILTFGNEMTKAKADWQFIIYGNTMHAFTNPLANDPGFGTVYNEKADKRARVATLDFLREVFA